MFMALSYGVLTIINLSNVFISHGDKQLEEFGELIKERAKRERRRLERKWRKSHNNTLYCKEFKQQCITVNKLLHKNRVDYYSNKLTIDESDTKTLFKVSRKLVGDDGNPTLPSCDNLLALTNQFSHYFCDKIEKLKSNITLEPSQSATYMERSFTGSTITAFEAISRESVNRIIQSNPAKT